MNYLSELFSFFDSIQNSSSRSLSYEQLIKEFFQYMYQEYGHDEKYFRKNFNPISVEYKDFNEYIYKHYIGLKRDLRMEYEKIEKEAKKNVKIYNERVNCLSNKVSSISPCEKYTREKYKFFLTINEELLQKAKKSREKINVFREALNNCLGVSELVRGFWSNNKLFRNIRQYEDFDWKLYINFLESSFEEIKELKEMKDSDNERYLILFNNYIDEHNILEKLRYIVSNNYYLYNRKEIIMEAVNLFMTGNYVSFVYLLVPQIEGLFDVYRCVLGINDEEFINGLTDKLKLIDTEQSLWGYVYYAFDFPVLRNDIAHGKMVNITTEIACDTLMDIFYLFHEIEDDKREYKIILEFLEIFSDSPIDKNSAYVLEYFSNKLQSEKKLGWLKKCLSGDYDSMIAWYNHTDTFDKLKEFFKSEKFQMSIYNYEPIEICNYDEIEGIEFINVNRKLVEYIPLLELLEHYISFPQKWMLDVKQRINDINVKVEENHKLIDSLILLKSNKN